jgi:hypothetical protein
MFSNELIIHCGTMVVPFRPPVLPALPSFESIERGFLFASTTGIWYTNAKSQRNGKLLATWTPTRNSWLCPHRSDEMAVDAAVSCVAQDCQCHRDVADMPRRLSGSGWFPADRQRVTNAYASPSTTKTEQRQPSTRWAIRRKTQCFGMKWATQTKDLRFGLTGYRSLRSSCRVPTYQQARQTDIPEGQPRYMARHGGGVRSSRCTPFFWLNQAALLLTEGTL